MTNLFRAMLSEIILAGEVEWMRTAGCEFVKIMVANGICASDLQAMYATSHNTRTSSITLIVIFTNGNMTMVNHA